jgi:hypothetical protein
MKLKVYLFLLLAMLSTNASALTYTYGFENISGPQVFDGVNMQTLDLGSASFSGGAVLTNATYFPAHSNFFTNNFSVYGTSKMGNNLPDTLTISLLPEFKATDVQFTLFNGRPDIQDYSINVYSGNNLLGTETKAGNNLKPNTTAINQGTLQDGEGSFAFVDLKYNDITSIEITYIPKSSTQTLPWDFLIDDVTFTGAGTGTFTQPVPEPEDYALMLVGLLLMGFVGRRRKML